MSCAAVYCFCLSMTEDTGVPDVQRALASRAGPHQVLPAGLRPVEGALCCFVCLHGCSLAVRLLGIFMSNVKLTMRFALQLPRGKRPDNNMMKVRMSASLFHCAFRTQPVPLLSGLSKADACVGRSASNERALQHVRHIHV